jgi:outer membrane protein OmpA-like peptidoglycan-associated protein
VPSSDRGTVPPFWYDFLKDFATKYDAVCMDFKGGRISKSEYTCRGNNMDQVLDKLRFFVSKVQAAKLLTDPSTQRDVVLKALDDPEASSKGGYSTGCSSSMGVDPKRIKFTGAIVVLVLQVSNFGPNLLIVTVQDVPAGLHADPKTETIEPSKTVNFAIYRLLMPSSTEKPLVLHLIDNFQDDIAVEVEIDGDNTSVYEGLAKQARRASREQNRAPTIDDALTVANDSLNKARAQDVKNRESVGYVLAAGILSQMDLSPAAKEALQFAAAQYPAMVDDPSILLLDGVISSQAGDYQNALRKFSMAKDHSAPGQRSYQNLSDIFTAVVISKTDKQKAKSILETPTIRKSLEDNPGYVSYVETAFKVPDIDDIHPGHLLSGVGQTSMTGSSAANQQHIAANQQNIAANSRQIEQNMRDITENTNRLTALRDYDVKGEATVKFDVGSSKISAQDQEELKKLAQTATGLSGYIIAVIGYADSSGSAAMKTKLSEERAKAVATFLIQQGNVPVRHIVAPAPVATNDTIAGRAENRRVEIKVLVKKSIPGK